MTMKRSPQHEPEVLAANAAAHSRDSSVRGVELISRSSARENLLEMGRLVRALPDALVLYVRAVFCVEGSYIVQLRKCTRIVATEIAICLERASGAANQILIESPDAGTLNISARGAQPDDERA